MRIAERWMAGACRLLMGVFVVLGSAVSPALASASAASFESPGVRAELAHELQQPGPAVVSQGAYGRQAAPAGEMVSSLSSAFSDTWRSKGHPLVTRVYSAPVNYEGSDGRWHPIDNSLVGGLGGYENAANSFSLRIPESLSAGVSLSDEGHSLAFTLVGALTAPAAVSGSTASYGEVLPSTNLSYVSQSSGVEEFATLKDTGAPSELTYRLSGSTGLQPREQPDGSIVLVDERGATWFTIPAPVAFARAAGAGAGRALPMSISASGSGWLLSVDTGEAWVREALAGGPVVVDPTVKIRGTASCELVAEAPKTPYCEQSTMQVGYDATHQEHHSLVEFVLASIPSESVILDAKLGLDLESHSTSNAKAVGVYRVTTQWSGRRNGGATWEEYEAGHAWKTAGGDYSNPSENSDASVNPSVGTANGWYFWYVTKMVQEWANGPNAPAGEGYAKDGLIIKDQTDNQTPNLLKFDSTGSSEYPYLEIAHEPRGEGSEPQYTMLSTPLTDRSSMSVNVASGNLMLESDDLHMAGVAGLDFESIRTWNSLNLEGVEEYGQWSDSNFNANRLWPYSDGTVAMEGPTGAWFTFVHQANDSFITPPGIKALMCETGSPEPCPKSLPSGSKYRLTYDASGTYVNYNAEGLGSGVHDRFGNVISVEYGKESGKVYTDTHNHKIEELQAGMFVTEIKDLSGGRNTKYEYSGNDEAAPLVSYTDANGKVTKYTYERCGGAEICVVSSATDPNGHITTFKYDSNDRVTEIKRVTKTSPDTGPTTRFVYYEVGEAPGKYCTSSQQATIVRDPDWTKPEKEETGEKFKLAAHETLYCANVLDEVERTFDAEGHETTATFDKFDNQTSTTAPARETGGSRGVTSLVYGTAGINLGCEVQGTSGSPLTECPKGALEHGYSTAANYEDEKYVSQPTAAISPRRKTTNICYWEGTHACTGTGGKGASGIGGALRQQADGFVSENALNFSYNKNGTVNTSEDPDEHLTSYEYDTSGNLKAVIAPFASTLGKKTITVDADGRPHVITQCLAESGGSCTSSETETITYDKIDRVTEAVYTGPGATKTFKYTYDGDGNLEKLVSPAGTSKFIYDPLNRLTEESLPESTSASYSYDEASNLLSFTDAGGSTHYFYNGLNELEAMYEPGGTCSGTPSKCTTFTYDGDQGLTRIAYPSGASLNYTLDPTTGRPTVIAAKSPSGETLLSNTYSYLEGTHDTPLIFQDTMSQPGVASDTTTYQYDLLDRLAEAKTTGTYPSRYEYELDGAGNRLNQEINPTGSTGGTKSYFVNNEGNELLCRMKENKACSKSSSTEIAGYSFEGAGNETAITGYSESASTTFAYNNLNQLTTLTPPSLGEQSLTYLEAGQSALTGLGSTKLQNSTLGLTKQTNEAGTSYYARTPTGLMVDERLPASTSYNPIYDAQGDIIGLLNTSGELKQAVRYGPYGDNAAASGSVSYSATNDPFLFQGGYHLAGGDTGAGNIPNDLYHYGERYYDPTTGKWTQPDPAGDGYSFAGDDPINESDPNGLFSLGEAWGWAEGQGKKLWHKAVKLVHWAINTQYAASHPGMRVPYTSEVANTCEVAGATTLFVPIPGTQFLKFVGSFAIYNNC